MIWTGRNILKTMYCIRKAVQNSDFPCTFNFDKETSIRFSYMQEDVQGHIIWSIGSKEMYETPNKVLLTEDALIPIIAMFHEACGHGIQVREEFNRERPLSTALALNHYACEASREYYDPACG